MRQARGLVDTDLLTISVSARSTRACCSIVLTEPIGDQFHVLIPAVTDRHPLGCHRQWIPDRLVFDRLVQVFVLGTACDKIANSACSATPICRQYDEWLAAGAFEELEQLCPEAYAKMMGFTLEDLALDGCITKAPCGGETAGHSPVGRGKQASKRSGEWDSTAGSSIIGCPVLSSRDARVVVGDSNEVPAVGGLTVVSVHVLLM